MDGILFFFLSFFWHVSCFYLNSSQLTSSVILDGILTRNGQGARQAEGITGQGCARCQEPGAIAGRS